ADIEIEERDRWVIVGGDGGEGWSGDRTGSVDADISWGDLTRTLVVGERPDLEVLTPDEYQSLRIGAGEPAWGADVDEGTIPQEAGLVEDAVDFTKGCYLGQELVARIDSRGRVVKRLRRLELDEPTEAGTPILVDGKEVGILTSVSGTTGMGMIRHEIEAGDRVKVGSTQA